MIVNDVLGNTIFIIHYTPVSQTVMRWRFTDHDVDNYHERLSGIQLLKLKITSLSSYTLRALMFFCVRVYVYVAQ